MRLAAVVLTLAACSSPAVTPSPSSPPPATAPDAAPTAVAPPSPTTAPSPPPDAAASPCLPRGAEPWFGAGGVIVACDFDYRPRVCHEVMPDGTVTPVPEPPGPLHATVSGRLVEICPGDGTECTLFEPEMTGDQVPRMADVDRNGRLATVVLHVPGADSAIAEVWDVSTTKRLARTTLTSRGTEQRYFYAWFLGRTILIGIQSDDVTEYSLWKRSGTKLKRFAKLDRSPFVWVVLDDRDVVMRWEDGGVDILDASTGMIAHPVAWDVLLPDPTPVKGVFLAQLGGGTYAVAPYDADRSLLALGVGDADGKVTPYPVTLCP